LPEDFLTAPAIPENSNTLVFDERSLLSFSANWNGKEDFSARVTFGFTDSGLGIRFYWQACKCCGVPSLLQYYVDNMYDDPEVRKRCAQGSLFLSNPLKARMLAVMAEDVVPHFCLQATGFAGLTVAEGIRNGATFDIFGKMPGK
jgi:hypothetical protein